MSIFTFCLLDKCTSGQNVQMDIRTCTWTYKDSKNDKIDKYTNGQKDNTVGVYE